MTDRLPRVKKRSLCGPAFSTAVRAGARFRTVVDTSARERELREDGTLGSRSASTGVNATLRILDLLAARGSLTLADVTRELGIAKSTVHRICSVLVDRAWAVRDQDGRYQLGIRALRLGSASAELPIVTAFHTVAAEFLDQLDETLVLAVLDGEESLFIAMTETSQRVRFVTHIGSKTPAFASASGRVVLASMPFEDVKRLFSGRSLVTPTGRRLGGLAELRSILDGVRRQGYAENWDETAHGLYAASVPVVNGDGKTLAALTTLVPLSRVSPERHETLLRVLEREGRRLSELVAWLPTFGTRGSNVA